MEQKLSNPIKRVDIIKPIERVDIIRPIQRLSQEELIANLRVQNAIMQDRYYEMQDCYSETIYRLDIIRQRAGSIVGNASAVLNNM